MTLRPRRPMLVLTAVVACAMLAGAQAPAPRSSRLIDAAALLRDAQALSADAMEGREVGSSGGARAREFLIARFEASGVERFGASYAAPFTFVVGRGASATTRRGVNVIGHVDGVRQPPRYIVVSAHYDHVGVRNGQIYNGADDNASGTAALIALASHFRDRRPQHSLIFAAFDGEEAGLRGSRAFVADLPVDRAAIVLNVNIDMIGRDAGRTLFAVGTFLNPFLKPYLQRVAVSAPVKLLLGHDNPNEKGVEDWTRDSDHWAFQQAGIPAVYLGVEDFDQHHKPTDDYETLTYDFFVGAAETALAVVREFDAHLDEIAGRK